MNRLFSTTAEVGIFHCQDQCADLIFTSPPYWPSPDYPIPACSWSDGWHGRLGQEPEVAKYAQHLQRIFALCQRLLKPEGLLWVVLGRHYGEHGCVDVPAELIVRLTNDRAHPWKLVEHFAWLKEGTGKPDSILIFSLTPRESLSGYGVLTDREIKPGPWTSFPPDMVEFAMAWGPNKGTLLDPFCGVGTALLAVKKQGWNFIGIDPDLPQVQQAAKSLEYPQEEIKVI